MPQNETIFFADFELDVSRRRLLKNGEVIALNSKTFDLLKFLIERKGEIVSKEEILEIVWEGQFIEEGNLPVHISNLRKIFGEGKKDNRFIATVPGRGYCFVADFRDEIVFQHRSLSKIVIEQEYHDDAGEIPPPNGTALVSPTAAAGRGRRNWLLLVAAAFFIGAFSVIALFFAQSSSSKDTFRLENRSIKRLTSSGTVERGALSHDGKLYAFAQRTGDLESIWLGPVDGGEPVQIVPPAHRSTWSIIFAPDGSGLYYSQSETSGSGTLSKIPLLGGVPEKIKDNVRHVALSPDGSQFAYLRYIESTGKLSILVAGNNGSNERQIATIPAGLDSDRHTPAWSPDGETIAITVGYNYDDTKLFAINYADGSVKQLGERPWNGLVGLSWLSDGSGLIAIGSRDDSFLQQLWLVSFPSGEARRLSSDLTTYYGSTSIAKDNALLTINGVNQSNIWASPAEDLGAARQITFGSTGQTNGWFGLAWAPDGRLIYSGTTLDGLTLYIVNGDGSAQRQLIPNGGANSYPSVPADGRFVVFQSNRGGNFAVWRVGLDGSDLRRLTENDSAGQPDVSSDGKWIVYNSQVNKSGQLWRIPADGGEPFRLTDKPAAWAQISPDSRSVACELKIDGKTRLGVLDIENGAVTKLFELPRLANLRLGVHWTPDGNAVTYRDWANGIWKQDINGGEPIRLEGLPQEKLFGYGWSPDGKSFAFSRGSTTTDLILISGSH